MSGGTQNYENYGNINPRLRDASGTAFFYLTEWLCFQIVEAIPGHPGQQGQRSLKIQHT